MRGGRVRGEIRERKKEVTHMVSVDNWQSHTRLIP